MVCELARSIGDDADPHAARGEAAEGGADVGPGPEVERAAVGGEALKQRAPVAEALVEHRGRLRAVVRQVELDPRPARGVLEPVPPQRPCVREHRVEVEGHCVHWRPC